MAPAIMQAGRRRLASIPLAYGLARAAADDEDLAEWMDGEQRHERRMLHHVHHPFSWRRRRDHHHHSPHGHSPHFHSPPPPPRPPSLPRCAIPIELLLILDRSSSLSGADGDAIKEFAGQVVDTFVVDPTLARVGIVQFNEAEMQPAEILSLIHISEPTRPY